jgi:hypothetical protein
MTKMWIDHITLAGARLPELQEDLLSVGIPTEYGGMHANGITHMAVAGFADGSYLELVAPMKADGRVMLWSDYPLPAYGGTAWTAASADLHEEFRIAAERGIASKGPVTISRKKPNGEVGTWDLGYFGSKQPGGVLPFLIRDETPRSVRITPRIETSKVLTGWTAMALAVHDIAASTQEFMRLYNWGPPEVVDGLTHFHGTPIYLGSPQEHLQKFGESPYAVILGALEAGPEFRTGETSRFADKNVHWLDLHASPLRIGLETL